MDRSACGIRQFGLILVRVSLFQPRTARNLTCSRRTETKHEAFHYYRGCGLRANRRDAIAPLHLGLGDYRQRSHCSRLVERDRVCNRGRACGDAVAGNAPVTLPGERAAAAEGRPTRIARRTAARG